MIIVCSNNRRHSSVPSARTQMSRSSVTARPRARVTYFTSARTPIKILDRRLNTPTWSSSVQSPAFRKVYPVRLPSSRRLSPSTSCRVTRTCLTRIWSQWSQLRSLCRTPTAIGIKQRSKEPATSKRSKSTKGLLRVSKRSRRSLGPPAMKKKRAQRELLGSKACVISQPRCSQDLTMQLPPPAMVTRREKRWCFRFRIVTLMSLVQLLSQIVIMSALVDLKCINSHRTTKSLTLLHKQNHL